MLAQKGQELILRNLEEFKIMRNTIDCVVITLLDTQNRIKDFINNAMKLKRRKENKFIEINNERL